MAALPPVLSLVRKICGAESARWLNATVPFLRYAAERVPSFRQTRAQSGLVALALVGGAVPPGGRSARAFFGLPLGWVELAAVPPSGAV